MSPRAAIRPGARIPRDAAHDRHGRIDRQLGQRQRLGRELEQGERIPRRRRVQAADRFVPDECGGRLPVEAPERQRR